MSQYKVTGFRYQYNQEDLERDLLTSFEAIGWRDRIKSDSKVFIKPNYTLPFYKPGVTTTREVVEAVAAVLKDRADDVVIGESDGGNSSFLGETALRNHGVPDICKRTGARYLDLSKCQRVRISEKVQSRRVEVTLPKPLLGFDESLSIPVMKVHVVVGVSLSLKNMWGCHPDSMRLLDHTHLPERLSLIAEMTNLHLAVIDSIYGLSRRGPMEGDVVNVGGVIVGNNAVATDAEVTRLMGFDPNHIRHIAIACDHGIGPINCDEIDIVGDLSDFKHDFTLSPTFIDKMGALTFRSDIITKLVFDSLFSKSIYRITGRKYRKRIEKPGDEL
jgi:uncharacterized protein (DUF362 family)